MTDKAPELEADTKKPEPEQESGKMSFLEHLDELRKRIVHIVVYVSVGFLVCIFFCKPIYDFLALPITRALPKGSKLVFTKPTDPFTLYMKVALLAGIFLTLPFILFEVWKFIAPGLYSKEKKYIVPFLIFSMVLFLGGAAFCYYIVLPPAFQFLIQLGSSFTPMININDYLELTNRMLLGFGAIFEMPVLAAFLSIFGLVTAGFLLRKFKYALIAIIILAAIISPTGDAYNLLLWSGPMVLLYFLSIGVAAIFGRRRKAKGLA
jgi:sec-independent protein translocase protein TatC